MPVYDDKKHHDLPVFAALFPRSDHDSELDDQRLFFHLQRWETQTRDLQNPESPLSDLHGCSRTLERGVL